MTGGYVSEETKDELARMMMGRSYDSLKPHEKGKVLGAARRQAGHEAEARGKGQQSGPGDAPRPQHMGKIIR
ncbi:hypothetical protein GPECTOR_427g296 [Gonium pectorale]|uniref:Uncharacterized protein n=1 Tax=Gonium pectorale TaxID=33097 RepID=A0A150FV61_GONPE|nr:hypothetical protein GPECTOR_427g296 [Gonium pectorale]|eukprot:KXZ41502.1 hypothetical protein GPECTOR_427g296 [Gonium pectorale]